uniref:Uncharacterized protein n=1 Tax=Pseudodiaptomus poplesia TaxID=213370 RepID=A0A1S6GLA1_9MAXI|nr:hypothetical protein [Pseudodiaptomus poplesia]
MRMLWCYLALLTVTLVSLLPDQANGAAYSAMTAYSVSPYFSGVKARAKRHVPIENVSFIQPVMGNEGPKPPTQADFKKNRHRYEEIEIEHVRGNNIDHMLGSWEPLGEGGEFHSNGHYFHTRTWNAGQQRF